MLRLGEVNYTDVLDMSSSEMQSFPISCRPARSELRRRDDPTYRRDIAIRLKCDGTTIFQRRLQSVNQRRTHCKLLAVVAFPLQFTCLLFELQLICHICRGRQKRRERRGLDNVATGCCSAAAEGEGPGLAAAEYTEQVWSRQAAGAEADDGDGAHRGNTQGW